MKNSLKLVMGVLFTVLMIGQALANSSQDINIRDNKHVYSFVPSDIKIIRGDNRNTDVKKYGNYLCDKNGHEIYEDRNKKAGTANNRGNENSDASGCMIYHSNSQNTSWVIRFVQNPGTSARAEQIFELKNKKLKLWAKFDPRNNVNIYASAEAQKFAGKKGDGNSNVAKQDESSPAGDIIKDAQKGDADELIKKGLGVMKGLKF